MHDLTLAAWACLSTKTVQSLTMVVVVVYLSKKCDEYLVVTTEQQQHLSWLRKIHMGINQIMCYNSDGTIFVAI